MDDVKKLVLGIDCSYQEREAGIIVNGISQGLGLTLLVVFSVTIAFAAVLFEGWSGEEE